MSAPLRESERARARAHKLFPKVAAGAGVEEGRSSPPCRHRPFSAAANKLVQREEVEPLTQTLSNGFCCVLNVPPCL